MKIDTHMENLEKKLDHLDKEIRDSYLHHDHDEEIYKLKRQKLIIKDQLQKLMNIVDKIEI